MQVAVNSTTRVIEVIGTNVGLRVGCVIEEIDSQTADRIHTASAVRNGGITLSSNHAVVTALPVPQSILDAEAAEAVADAADATDRAQLAALDAALEAYIGIATPTLVQTATAAKAEARALRYMIRRLVRKRVL